MTDFFINGQAVTAQKGETILEVARRTGHYIPTMCYLPKVSPISSCRLCVVEVDESKGMILSCQTPPTAGIHVKTNSDELYEQRQNIMKLYDVNHPLECGVCDKSGECDLQNKTLEFDITAQNFTTRDQSRSMQKWGMINYDPNLCIMCEKCVSTCNEAIGDDAIEVKFGGYNSTIIPKNSDVLDCSYCGECIAVCPVGALISDDFQYTTNAWELEKIPSSCTHCSAACSLRYDVKQTSISNSENSIYRVKNDFEFNSLCGAGRFGFDYANENVTKDESRFNVAVETLKNADTIAFNSVITNEEALILQSIKEKHGIKLYNPDAKAYQEFTKAFSQTSGEHFYSADLNTLSESDFVITVGSRLFSDNPAVRYALTQAFKKQRAYISYMHPMEDSELQNVVQNFIKYEVGSEEGVLALLASAFVDNGSENIQKYLNDLDMGYLSAESNVGEEEISSLKKKSLRAKKFTLVLGEDLINHKNAINIAKLAGIIERYSEFNVLIVAPETNTLGVSLICDLDETSGENVVGYNVEGDFILNALGAKNDNELDMPALNQQEGTITNIDKRVVTINAALSYEGYALNDLANAMDIKKVYTVDYTSFLPLNRGFKAIKFDDLSNEFTVLGEDSRGYLLNLDKDEYPLTIDERLDEVDSIGEFNGTVIYRCNPVLQFNAFTNKTKQLPKESLLIGSVQFSKIAKISDGDNVELKFGEKSITKMFKIDTSLKGTIGLLSTFDNDISTKGVFLPYRFEKVNIMSAGQLNE